MSPLESQIQTIRARGRQLDYSDRDEVVSVLCFLWQIIRASERLLETAITEAGVHECPELMRYYAKHLEEERHHAEWLLEDLGGKKVYSPLAAALAGTQYYLIQHEHPAALLGYMLALESQTLPLHFVAGMEALHGKELLRTLRLHSEEDPGHRDDLLRVIDAHPKHAGLIAFNAAQTAHYLAMY